MAEKINANKRFGFFDRLRSYLRIRKGYQIYLNRDYHSDPKAQFKIRKQDVCISIDVRLDSYGTATVQAMLGILKLNQVWHMSGPYRLVFRNVD